MEHKRRLLSMLLAVMLIITLVPLSVFAGTFPAPAAGDVVTIPDGQFKALLNHEVDPARPADADLTTDDLATLTSLSVNTAFNDEFEVTNIEGVQYAVNLKSLTVYYDVDGLEQIRGLQKLTSLTIYNNELVRDLTMVGSKPELEILRVSSCPNLTTLDGLTAVNCPKLQELDLSRNGALSDLSALDNVAFPALEELDLEGESKVSDITPLMEYANLTNLNLEKVDITAENRQGYQQTIASLTGLEELWMPYCEVTDVDTAMFAPLDQLKILVLDANNLTSTAFCDELPLTLEELGLSSNDLDSMDNLGRLENLTILNVSGNAVTDFSFIGNLKKLTNGSIRHAEGSESFPTVELYSYGSSENPIVIEGDQVTFANPYIGPDGRPISFAGAVITDVEGGMPTVSYDAATNQITVTGVDGDVTIRQRYLMPMGDGSEKVCNLRIRVFTKEQSKYTIHYSWGDEAPQDQTLPVDSNEYKTLEEAQAALDRTFTSQTVVRGEKDGEEGLWRFSGWTVTVQDYQVRAVGQWSFEAHQHTWGTPVYTWSEDGTTCTATRTCVEDAAHVETETVEVVGQVTTPATCTSMGKTTYTADFSSDWAQTQTRVVEDIPMTPHTYGTQWTADETDHWHGCVCGAKADVASHTFEWVIDREATETEPGSKHQECSVCHYQLAAVEIPVLDPGEEKPDVPETGDASGVMPALLLCTAAGAMAVTLHVKRKKEHE